MKLAGVLTLVTLRYNVENLQATISSWINLIAGNSHSDSNLQRTRIQYLLRKKLRGFLSGQ